MFAAMLHGFSHVSLGTHDGQGRNKVRFDKFPQGGNESATGEVFLWGSSSRPQTGGPTLTNEASIEGRFRFAGKKTWPIAGEDLTGRRLGRSSKNEAKGQRAQNHATRGTEKRQAMRRASPRCPARQPERLISRTAIFNRAARQQGFGHHCTIPATPP